MTTSERSDDMIERIQDAFHRQAIPPRPADLMSPVIDSSPVQVNSQPPVESQLPVESDGLVEPHAFAEPHRAIESGESRRGVELVSRLAATGTVAIAVSLLAIALIRMKPSESDGEEGLGETALAVENAIDDENERPDPLTSPVDPVGDPPGAESAIVEPDSIDVTRTESTPVEVGPAEVNSDEVNSDEVAPIDVTTTVPVQADPVPVAVHPVDGRDVAAAPVEQRSEAGASAVRGPAESVATDKNAVLNSQAAGSEDEDLEAFGVSNSDGAERSDQSSFVGFDAYFAMESLVKVLEGDRTFSKAQVLPWAELFEVLDDRSVEALREALGTITGLSVQPNDARLPREIQTDPKRQAVYSFRYQTDRLLGDARRIVNHCLDDDVFDDILEGLRNDPEGPRVDVREFLHRRLAGLVWVVVDKVANKREPQMLFVFSVRDQQAFHDDMQRALSKEPEAVKLDLGDGEINAYSVEKIEMYWTKSYWVVGSPKMVWRSLEKPAR